MSVRSNLSRAMRKAKAASSPSWLAVAPRSRAEDEVLRESLAGLSRPRSREQDEMLREALAGAVEMTARARARSASALSNDLENEYGVPPATVPAAAQDVDAAWSAVPLPPVPRVESSSTPQPRHVARCGICQHPSRELIERDFIEWHSVYSICANYELPSRRTMYLHARAAGLFAERRRNVHLALENLIEQADAVRPSGMAIVKAVELHARISAAASRPPSAKANRRNADGETASGAEAQIPALPEPENSASSLPELPPVEV